MQNKKRFRPTIENSKTWLLKLVDEEALIDAGLDLMKKDRKKRLLEIYPVIFGIGESNRSISNFVVAFESIRYTFDTFVEALDATFKFYVYFKIKFSPEHQRFWDLINGIFYKIDLEVEITSATSSILQSFDI